MLLTNLLFGDAYRRYRSGIIESTTFSMCFRRYNNRNLDSAGTLTIGGYNSDFLTSPMVYMENTAINGKYSTIITNLYLRESGGESVTPFSESQKVVKLFFDKDAANSGPGTVIDTSYPGTLLNVAILNSLQNEWFVMTGRPYLDVPISLTEEEMLSLPTVLVQLKTSFTDNTFTDPNKVVGMVGDELDPVRMLNVVASISFVRFISTCRYLCADFTPGRSSGYSSNSLHVERKEWNVQKYVILHS
jgi:hypothetical protein